MWRRLVRSHRTSHKEVSRSIESWRSWRARIKEWEKEREREQEWKKKEEIISPTGARQEALAAKQVKRRQTTDHSERATTPAFFVLREYRTLDHGYKRSEPCRSPGSGYSVGAKNVLRRDHGRIPQGTPMESVRVSNLCHIRLWLLRFRASVAKFLPHQ